MCHLTVGVRVGVHNRIATWALMSLLRCRTWAKQHAISSAPSKAATVRHAHLAHCLCIFTTALCLLSWSVKGNLLTLVSKTFRAFEFDADGLFSFRLFLPAPGGISQRAVIPGEPEHCHFESYGQNQRGNSVEQFNIIEKKAVKETAVSLK